MAKFEGLIWKKGDDGWKDIPVGIGYVPKGFDVETDEAAMRVEGEVKAGYGGKKVDFRNINDLLKACPPEGTVSASNPPKVIYAAVHPTNLEAAIIVWSAPVVIIDPSKIGGGGASLNGRVMTVGIVGVSIDGSDSETIAIGAGAVGAYGTINDPNEAAVTDTLTQMYAGTKNDTSVGDDQTSQSNGQEIPLFIPCEQESVTVSVSMTYKMEDAKQRCGEPHKIWGACYCVWGSTTPMETFPFGQTMDLNPGSLGPDSGFYGGTVAKDSYVDRGEQFKIAIAGVAGPTVQVDSVNDAMFPLQPGQAVAFQSYLCSTVCGIDKMTQITESDTALAYVDEDIIKPSERTLPVYTFLETTYYMTTMFAITTTEIPMLLTSTLYETSVTSVWQGTVILASVMPYYTAICVPEDDPTQDIKAFSLDGDPNIRIPLLPYEEKTILKALGEVTTDVGLAKLPAAPIPLVELSQLAGIKFCHSPTDDVVAVPYPDTYSIYTIDKTDIQVFTTVSTPILSTDVTRVATSALYAGYYVLDSNQYPVNPTIDYRVSIKQQSIQDYLARGVGPSQKVAAATQPAPLAIKQVTVGTPVSTGLPPPDSKVITSIPDSVTLTRSTITLRTVPSGGQVITGGGTIAIGSTELVVCQEGGGKVTLTLVTLGGSTNVLTGSLANASDVPLTYLQAAANVNVLTGINTAALTPVDIVPVTAQPDVNVLTTIALEDPVVSTITVPVALPDVLVATSLPIVFPKPLNICTDIEFATPAPAAVGVYAGPCSVVTDIATQTMVWHTFMTAAVTELPTTLMSLVTTIVAVATEKIELATAFEDLRLEEFKLDHYKIKYPDPIELTKFSKLTNITYITPNESDKKHTLLSPHPESMLTLPFLDTNKTIPILDVAGEEDKAVKLLISNTDGNLKLVGMEDPLVGNNTVRVQRGVCTPGGTTVISTPGADYEEDGEIKLLSPIPVRKNKGTAEQCPCFTVADPSGGPSAPTDNSTLGSMNPCTLRVRRIQLKECHK